VPGWWRDCRWRTSGYSPESHWDRKRRDLTTTDITAAVWALRGVIQAERTEPLRRGQALWRRHLQTVLRGFRDDEPGDG
jgi:hypothetical protein